jgi:hypothetical protein
MRGWSGPSLERRVLILRIFTSTRGRVWRQKGKRATHQVLFAAAAAALYSGVPLAGIVQKYTVLPLVLSVC